MSQCPPFSSNHQEHTYSSWMLWGWDGKLSFFLPSLTVVPCFAQKPICCWCSACSTVLCSPPPQAVAVGFSSSYPKSHLLSAANKLQLRMTPKENRGHAASDLADGSICFVTFIFFLLAYRNSSVYKDPFISVPTCPRFFLLQPPALHSAHPASWARPFW